MCRCCRHLTLITVIVTRTQCKNAIKLYSSRAYCLFYACVRNDFVCDGDRACRATYRVPGSTTNANRLCARARRQLSRPLETKQRCIHLSSDAFTSAAMHSPRQRFKEALRRAPTHTLSFIVANSPQATADQHDRQLVPSPSHHSPL